jgi:ribosomal-protein-alanine N-acetyltransferase
MAHRLLPLCCQPRKGEKSLLQSIKLITYKNSKCWINLLNVHATYYHNCSFNSSQLTDVGALGGFYARNKEHLASWETPQSSNHIWEDQITLWTKEQAQGNSVRFLIFAKEQPEILIGMCNFTQICRGPFLACYLGYKIDYASEGMGMMREALEGAIRYVFEDLKLHRIMANYIPTNERSAKLLDSLNFAIEGYAKSYLYINGHWHDHVLTALWYERWIETLEPEK